MAQPTLKVLAAAVLLAATGAATAQEKLRFSPGEGFIFTPRYEVATAAAEGHCRLQVWVDDRATVLLRGDQIGVRTHSGDQARDEGSYCTGPLPATVDDFRIVNSNSPRGGRVTEISAPNARNGHTGSVSIYDPENGGRLYVLDVRWSDPNFRAPRVVTAPGYERFNEEEACQERVRSEIQARNRGNVDVEFRPNVRREQLGSGRERIRGGGFAERRDDYTRFGYVCIVDDRNNRVLSASYEVRGQGEGNIR